MIHFEQKKNYKFNDLIEIMTILRKECMWDKEQTHESIRRNFIEETYEVIEAIDDENSTLMCEELGDVMLQVVFHTEIEKEKGSFNIDDVTDGICKKLIYRHPHIFKDTEVSSTIDILRNWEELKKIEKGQKTATDAVASVAKSLPSLIRAEKIQSKAHKVGFDWNDISGAIDKTKEEFYELTQAINGKGDPEEELGDLLFSVVNIARFLKVDSEGALEKTCNKFIERFSYIEKRAKAQGKELQKMSLEEMDELWNEKKDIEKSAKGE